MTAYKRCHGIDAGDLGDLLILLDVKYLIFGWLSNDLLFKPNSKILLVTLLLFVYQQQMALNFELVGSWNQLK